VPPKKRPQGRDPFEDQKEKRDSTSVSRLITRKVMPGKPEAKEVSVRVRLTPSNLKHLDRIRERLASQRGRDFSRNDLIRIAITLLSADDVT